MKTKILFLLAILSINAWNVSAQASKYDINSHYAPYVDDSQLIVRFEEGRSEVDGRKLLDEFNDLISNVLVLPSPKVSIVKTRTKNDLPAYFDLISALESVEGIQYVGLYMHNGDGYSFGILDKLFVKLKDGADKEKLANSIHQKGVTKLEDYQYDSLVQHFYIDKTANTHPLAMAMTLHNSGEYQFAEPNYLLNPLVNSTDPLFYKQWSLENNGSTDQWEGTPGADMSVTEAWTLTKGDPDILIAIMDSGIDTLHPDLYDQYLSGFDATGQGTNGYPRPNYREDGHGTACAGIIAADADNGHGISGVAPECKVTSSRIFYYADTSFFGIALGVIPFSTSQFMADGTHWAWQVANADIQSHSWSLPDLFLIAGFPEGDPSIVDDALQQAFTQGRGGKGCLLFFSSGNEGEAPNWPGRDAHSMAVNATSYCDEAKTPTSCDEQDWTGNWGANLAFGAPGVRVTTLDMLDTFGFSSGDYVLSFGGTSAACPNAAGVAALMLAANPDYQATTYRKLLKKTCDKVGGYAYNTWTPDGAWSAELGHGRLNAYEAVLATLNFTSIAEVGDQNDLWVWPNPAVDWLYLETSQGVVEEIVIYNSSGQLMAHNYGEVSRFSVADWAAGVYFLKVKVDEVWKVEKVLVGY